MAINLHVETGSRMSLEAFIERVCESIDLHDADSLIGLASDFRALANDPSVLSRRLNAFIDTHLETPDVANEPATRLGEGEGFVVQAHIWTPPKLAQQFRCESEPSEPSRFAHNHNYSVMTVGHFGPGCATDVYSIAADRVRGDVGERIELQFREHIQLTPQTVMIYREHVDVHSHRAPESLSISLSLAMFNDEASCADQYVFDLQSNTISGYGERAPMHRRASLMKLAGDVGDNDTLGLMDRMIRRSENPRLREAAVMAIACMQRVEKSERLDVLERALRDGDAKVRECAEEILERLAE